MHRQLDSASLLSSAITAVIGTIPGRFTVKHRHSSGAHTPPQRVRAYLAIMPGQSQIAIPEVGKNSHQAGSEVCIPKCERQEHHFVTVTLHVSDAHLTRYAWACSYGSPAER